MPRPSLLHVTNGESAGNTLRQTTLGGAVLPWQDVLHEGPVPSRPRRDLLRTRARSWPTAAGVAAARCSPRSSGATGSTSRRSATVSRSCSGSSTTSTTSSNSSTCSRSPTHRAAAPELIVIGSFPGKPTFAGLGELTPDELETLWPSRRGGGTEALADATDAWAALRAPEPAALAEWATRRTRTCRSSPPRCGGCSRSCPRRADGLSGTERRALQAVAAGARTPAAAFVAAQELEEAPFLGDAWFYRALSSSAPAGHELLETQDGEPLPPPPPLGDGQPFARLQLRLTATGNGGSRRGRPSRAPRHRPLDRRHARHSERIWRWDGAAQQLTEPA